MSGPRRRRRREHRGRALAGQGARCGAVGDQLAAQLGERTRELEEVAEVGVALSTVRDHGVLLTMILSKARELSRADAGSLYLLDHRDGERVLRWKLAQSDSIDVE